jgi:hypothetical protein
MLDVQALRFARMFRRQVDLRITQREAEDFLLDLFESRRQAEAKGESTAPFDEAEAEYLRADAEGRLKLLPP